MSRFLKIKYILLGLLLCFAGYGWSQTTGAADPAVDTSRDVSADLPSATIDTLDIKDMDINDVLKLLAAKSGLNIIAGKSITGRVTIFLQNVDVHDALSVVLKANGLAYIESHGVIQIMTEDEYEQVIGHRFGASVKSAIVVLQSVKASDVAAILNQVKSKDGKIIPDDQSNSIIIEDLPGNLKQLLDYIKVLDVQTTMRVYKLQYVSGESLVPKIEGMLTPKIGGVKFDGLSNKLFIKDNLKKLADIFRYLRQVDVPRESRVFQINYAKADELAKTIGPMLTKDVGSVEFDTRSNTIVVTDISPKIAEISDLIDALDHVDKEVFIEAKIVQIALNNEYQMGVNWDKVILRTNNTQLQFGSNFPIPGGITTGIGTASIGTLSSGTFNDVIQALDTFGKSRTLSSPRLAALNNQEASILIGTTIPYTTTTGVTNSIGTTNSESVNFIDTGVKLHVTPTIHDDGYITMKIKPEISNEETKPFTAPDGSVIPIVDTSEVQTTVRVKDGVTIIIGGLMKDERISNTTKIPVLGDLPFVGKAFSNVDRSVQKTEIVIFLTPHIINGDVHTDADEYIAKSSAIKGEKTYYDPLPKEQSTPPVP